MLKMYSPIGRILFQDMLHNKNSRRSQLFKQQHQNKKKLLLLKTNILGMVMDMDQTIEINI